MQPSKDWNLIKFLVNIYSTLAFGIFVRPEGRAFKASYWDNDALKIHEHEEDSVKQLIDSCNNRISNNYSNVI